MKKAVIEDASIELLELFDDEMKKMNTLLGSI